MTDDDDEIARSLKRLSTASKGLKAAQKASRDTVRQVNRAKRAVAKATKEMTRVEHPKIRSRRKRR